MDNQFPVRKNIRLDFVFRALFSFAICDGIFVLFLAKKGPPMWQIGLLEGVFHLTGILSEIPSGALADLWGRKWVMLCSRLCGLTSSVIILSTGNFWVLCVGFVFAGLSHNLNSGSEEALVYDTLLQGGQENRFFKLNSRLSFLTEISGGLALLAGGFLAEHSYVLCYLAAMAIESISAVICVLFTEPRNSEKSMTVKKHFRTAADILRNGRQLRFVLLYFAVLFGFDTSTFLYSQQFYFSRGLTESRIAMLMIGVSVCSSLGALCSERLSRVLKEHASTFAGAVCALGIMLMFSKNLALSILGCGLSRLCSAALYPIQSNQINRLIPSAQRATLLSVNSMCFSAVMIVLFPVMGAVMEWAGPALAFLGAGAALLVYTAVMAGKTAKEMK